MPITAVFDTNLWVSALRNSGKPRKLVHIFASTNKVTIHCADELLTELIRVLKRPKFAKDIIQEDANELIELIRAKAVFAQLIHTPTVSTDPKDNIFLGCAASLHSDFLVTGDKRHLQSLGQYEQTKIVSPAEFLEILELQYPD